MFVDKAVADILGSKKYSGLDKTAVERICAELAPRYQKYGDAVKAIKRELHIIYGSFLTGDCHAKAESLIRGYGGNDIHADIDFAVRLMELHVSTSERAGFAAEAGAIAGSRVRHDDLLIDIGCGFNPFSLPFFPVKPKAYMAFDICSRTTDLINNYFKPLGPTYRARPLDVITCTPPAKAGVVLMYKLFPLLEQQRKGRAFELLGAMDFRFAIVSFPTKSASGREKGMEAHYTDMFMRGLPGKLSVERKAVFVNELFFIVKRR